jgi:hypothetical protein
MLLPHSYMQGVHFSCTMYLLYKIHTTHLCITLLLLVLIPFCVISTLAPVGSFNIFLVYGVRTHVLGKNIYGMRQNYTHSSSIIRQSVQKCRGFPRYTYTTKAFSKIHWILILNSSHRTPQVPVKVDQGLLNYQCKWTTTNKQKSSLHCIAYSFALIVSTLEITLGILILILYNLSDRKIT